MFQQLDEKREPLLARARQYLIDYRRDLLVLPVAFFYVFLFLGGPALLESSWNGVWFRAAADKSMPSEMLLHTTPHKSRLKITVGVPLTCAPEHETFTLLLDD
ncbi:MAG TPA: hypothetical protein VKB38_02205 [Terracidiphilus sp.]|nr:hypothetical protein [Terracidiphilus sp.]